MSILLGCDPELFIHNKKTTRPVPAYGLLPGTKQEPHMVPLGAIQVDGCAAEFNINPAKNLAEWWDNIYLVKQRLDRMVRDINADLELKASPVVYFTRRDWSKLPPEAKELGCEPDFSAYTRQANPAPDAGGMMRTGSGHVHISWGEAAPALTPEYMEKCAELVRRLDNVMIPQSKKWDADTKRAELYGKPGAFRPKPYGLEYRVLSNAWLNHGTSVIYVYKTIYEITKDWFEGKKEEECAYPDYFQVTKDSDRASF
jgi:hypothetical protein